MLLRGVLRRYWSLPLKDQFQNAVQQLAVAQSKPGQHPFNAEEAPLMSPLVLIDSRNASRRVAHLMVLQDKKRGYCLATM